MRTAALTFKGKFPMKIAERHGTTPGAKSYELRWKRLVMREHFTRETKNGSDGGHRRTWRQHPRGVTIALPAFGVGLGYLERGGEWTEREGSEVMKGK
ncbi:hypothetical protein EVAR_57892_1 [Eumeta japonica]|uniref:Uncharacterized protein n=1 Tax=Eumeta variegata TaxID=151549 RepID=A0A4C1YR53_EUMVA|nr:hypothetical protein EVAR_57892_1 [Eumeta japonica]